MKTHILPTLRRIFLSALVAVLLFALHVPAPAYEGSLEVELPRVTMFYQPPGDRGSLANLLVLQREVEQMNLVAVVLDNYLNHLIHLGKVSSLPQVHFEYVPSAEESGPGEAGRLLLNTLGLENALLTINDWLKKQSPQLAHTNLLQREHLFELPRPVPLASGTVEDGFGFACLSDRLPELAPEGDFAVLPDRRVLVSRPTAGMNRFLALPLDPGARVDCAVEPGQHFKTGLQASADGKWLFYLSGEQSMIAPLGSGTPIELFPKSEHWLFLDGSWSPTGARFVGIAQTKETGQRRLFLFDGQKGALSPFFDQHPELDADYQFAWPCWSPTGQQLLLSTGNEINLVDLANDRVEMRVVQLPQTETITICEMLWVPDGRSFYYSTVIGMSRDKRQYDANDFSNTAITHVDLTPGHGPVERKVFVRPGFIKLLQVCPEGRLVFLQGRLKTQRYRSPLWNFDGFTAFATRDPAAPVTPGTATGPVEIKLKYAFALRNLDSKFANVVDVGQHRSNLLFNPHQITSWFIGTDLASGPLPVAHSFDMRQPPYPFGDRNRVYCLGLDASVVKPFLDFMSGYRISSFDLDADLRRVYFLSNTRGPMALWSGRLDRVCEVKFAQPKAFSVGPDDADTGAGSPGTGPEAPTEDLPPSASILPPSMPGPGSGAGSGAMSPDRGDLPPSASVLPPMLPPPLPDAGRDQSGKRSETADDKPPSGSGYAAPDDGFGKIPSATMLPPPLPVGAGSGSDRASGSGSSR